jgi:aconitate hydratase
MKEPATLSNGPSRMIDEGGGARPKPTDTPEKGSIHPSVGDVVSIYDAAIAYKSLGVPTIVLAGAEYGTGSSRDWAAKGTLLLGVRAVIAQSFERIHRSNLVNMGVLPLQFRSGDTAASLGLSGREEFAVLGVTSMSPRGQVTVQVTGPDQSVRQFPVVLRIDTPEELEAFRHGGILPYVLRQLASRG